MALDACVAHLVWVKASAIQPSTPFTMNEWDYLCRRIGFGARCEKLAKRGNWMEYPHFKRENAKGWKIDISHGECIYKHIPLESQPCNQCFCFEPLQQMNCVSAFFVFPHFSWPKVRMNHLQRKRFTAAIPWAFDKFFCRLSFAV